MKIKMNKNEEDKILTAEEAAEYLRMALSTLYRYMRKGQVPCFKVGNQWRFRKSVLDQWLDRISTLNINISVGKEIKELSMKSANESATKKDETKENVNISFDLGLGGIFKGIGSLIELAAELAEKEATEIKKEGQIGPIGDKGLKAVYGFSVKVGSGGKPVIQQFGNVKEEAKGPVVDDVREPMVDTFDEGDFVLVVAEMPGVDEAEIKYEIKKDILIIAAGAGDRKYYKELLLSTPVDETKSSQAYKNGILEIKLWKAK
jgi:HSP20 family protein